MFLIQFEENYNDTFEKLYPVHWPEKNSIDPVFQVWSLPKS